MVVNTNEQRQPHAVVQNLEMAKPQETDAKEHRMERVVQKAVVPMQERMRVASMRQGRPSRALVPGEEIFSEGFENLTGHSFARGWTIFPEQTESLVVGAWFANASQRFVFVTEGASGTAEFAGISAQQSGAVDGHLWSPGIDLDADNSYLISFYFQAFALANPATNVWDAFIVSVTNMPAMGAGATERVVIYTRPHETFSQWTRIDVPFQPNRTGIHHLEFRVANGTGAGQIGGGVLLDEVSVRRMEPRDNDLAITTTEFVFPYTQMPVGVLAQEVAWRPAPATVRNIGSNPMTNVVTTVNLNDVLLETSTAISSIAPRNYETVIFGEQIFSSTALTLEQRQGFTLTYSVEATETDDDMSDNVSEQTDTVRGTANLLAVHYGGEYTRNLVQWGTGGNVFTITNTVTLEYVSVDLWVAANSTPAQNFIVEIFRMDDQGRVITGNLIGGVWSESLFSVDQTRPVGTANTVAELIVPVPLTILTPGRYFLAVTQAGTNVGLIGDGRYGAPSFEFLNAVITPGYRELDTPTASGAWAIGMIFADFGFHSKTPIADAENVLLNEEIRVNFTVARGLIPLDLDLVTITPNLTGFAVSIDDNALVIAHDGLAPGIEYTVTIPVGTLANIDEEITWSFETVEGYDVAVIAITSPMSGKNLTNETVTATIKNVGGHTITTLEMELSLNDAIIATETFTGTLASGVSYDFTFVAVADLSVARHNTIAVTATLLNDQNTDNNSDTISVLNCFPTAGDAFAQDFESTVFPPVCWVLERKNPLTDTWGRNTATPRPGSTGHIRHPFPTINTKQISMLITEAIEIPDAGIYELVFWTRWAWGAGNHNLGVWVSTTDNDTASFSEVFEVTTAVGGQSVTPSPWSEIAISLEAFQGETIYIAFRYLGDRRAGEASANWDIDDISIQSALLRTISRSPVTNATGVAIDENIVVTFNMDVTYSDFEDILIEPQVDILGVSIVDNRNLVITHDGFAHATVYTVTIPAGTIVGFDEVITWSFRTEPSCNPISEFPWRESFPAIPDFTVILFPPDCWEIYTENPDVATWVRNTLTVRPGTTAHARHAGTVASAEQTSWLITQAIEIPATGVYHLSFWTRFSGAVTAHAYSGVWVSTTGVPGSFTELHELTITSTGSALTGWQEILVPLNRFQGQIIYLAFKYESNPVGIASHNWDITDLSIVETTGDIALMQVGFGAGFETSVTNPDGTETIRVEVRHNLSRPLSVTDTILVTLALEGPNNFEIERLHTLTGLTTSAGVAFFANFEDLGLDEATVGNFEATVTATWNGQAIISILENISLTVHMYDVGITAMYLYRTEGNIELTNAVDNPQTLRDLAKETLIVTVRNFGTLELTEIYLMIRLNDENLANEAGYELYIWDLSATPLLPNTEREFRAQRIADFTPTAPETTEEFTITAFAGLETGLDWNATNDTLRVTIVSTIEDETSIDIPRVVATVVTIYPNPVDDILHIQTTEMVRRIEIFNVLGTLMMTVDGNATAIDVSNLPSGVYVIRFVTETGGAIQRFVKR